MDRVEKFSITSSAIMAFGILTVVASVSQILNSGGSLNILLHYIIGLCGIIATVWGFVYDV